MDLRELQSLYNHSQEVQNETQKILADVQSTEFIDYHPPFIKRSLEEIIAVQIEMIDEVISLMKEIGKLEMPKN